MTYNRYTGVTLGLSELQRSKTGVTKWLQLGIQLKTSRFHYSQSFRILIPLRKRKRTVINIRTIPPDRVIVKNNSVLRRNRLFVQYSQYYLTFRTIQDEDVLSLNMFGIGFHIINYRIAFRTFHTRSTSAVITFYCYYPVRIFSRLNLQYSFHVIYGLTSHYVPKNINHSTGFF
jgi:hypothetical protein